MAQLLTTLCGGAGEQVARLAVQRITEGRQGRPFERFGTFGLGEVVAGRHREAGQLGQSVGGHSLRFQHGGELPEESHGQKVGANVSLDNTKAWPYVPAHPNGPEGP